MKLLVFADTHGYLRPMLETVQKESPDMVLHLGDLLRDARTVAAAYPQLPVKCVSGNWDGRTTEPAQQLIEVAGQRILMGHGHFWRVKQGYETAIAAAHAAHADILLFGHTHLSYCDRIGDLWVMNPGAASGGRGKIHGANYGIIRLENGNTLCYTVTN